MRVIITCAGPQTKWDNYLGVRSHFAPVLAPRHEEYWYEPLLQRTLRQVKKYEPNDVHVTAPVGSGGAYQFDGIETHEVTGDSEFTSTRHLWNPTGRTVLLLGDVYFSDLAIKKIMGFKLRKYRCFGRSNGSNVTGTPYGEIFAHSWYGPQNAVIDEHLEHVAWGRGQGITRPAGWMLLRSFQDVPMTRHVVKPEFFEQIYDWTDDIDFPADFHRHPATRGYCDSISSDPLPS